MLKGLLLTALLSVTFYVYGQAYEEEIAQVVDAEQPSDPAPQEAVNLAKEACETWAVADEIPDSELNEYIRNCIDDELEYHGYRPLNPRSNLD